MASVRMERLWAGWRAAYIEAFTAERDGDAECLFCALGAGLPDDVGLITRNDLVFAVLNAYPYTSGHLMVAPQRHVGELEELSSSEAAALMAMLQAATVALKEAYRPDGLNVGLNLGRAAGAGVPGHLHVHVLPRWEGDTNFMTSIAEARVLPESLDVTRDKLRAAWPMTA